MFNVTITNGKTFSVDPKSSILDAARAQGIVLEHSCRNGRCGVCKAPVTAGTTDVLRAEEALSAEERANSIVLTCCRTATSDVNLAIEDLGRLAGVSTRTLPCRITAIERVSDSIVQVFLRLPPNAKLDDLAGQYLDIIHKGVRRSYSVANACQPNGIIELNIRRFEHGVMSCYWFEEARENDLLRFEAPLGTFFLREIEARHIIFLATGTGIAPVKAMLEELTAAPAQMTGRSISVYWGNRVTADFYWAPAELSRDVRFAPVLSGPDALWTGRRGHVQHALLADGPDLAASVVYACGSDAMIKSAQKLLCDEGLPPSRFYSDAFLSSN